MKKVISFTLVISMLFLGTNCASIIKGNSSKVDFGSTPRGAQVYVNGYYMGDTPIRVKLESKRAHSIEFKKEGYRTKTFNITNHVGVGWIILDILFGLIPVIVDAATGAWYDLDQKNVNAMLERQKPMEEPEVAIEEKVVRIVEAKDVKIHLKDGTVLRAKILSQDNQQMNVETSMGKLAIAQKDILKIELLKEKAEEKFVKVYLKDGTVLKAKILSEDEQKIYVETSMGKFRFSRKDILKIEKVKKKEQAPDEKPIIVKKEKESPAEKPGIAKEEMDELLEKLEKESSKPPRKIEVIIDNSEIRLKPDRQSQVIGKVRFGAILQAIGKTGDWYKINLPSSVEGVVISGYIHKFCIRVIVEKN